jgi:pimeloyl-ACP methyl ester carboxylesterase
MPRQAGLFSILVTVALATVIVAGCNLDQRPYMTDERLDAGLVVSLDGIGGYNWGPRWLREGLDETGLKTAIVIYDWSKGPTGFWVGDLVDRERNIETARELAHMVATYIETKPNRPVTLIGHSGGAAVVMWALEELPKGVQVERAILLAPALVPEYNMAKALRGVRSRMYVMYSHADIALMGIGTTLFGGMDRQHGIAAGLVGFDLPKNISAQDKVEYGKVRQIGWSMSLLGAGAWGGHMGWTTTRFAREFIAPILTGTSDPGDPLVVIGNK